jgi:hypothetical protein
VESRSRAHEPHMHRTRLKTSRSAGFSIFTTPLWFCPERSGQIWPL